MEFRDVRLRYGRLPNEETAAAAVVEGGGKKKPAAAASKAAQPLTAVVVVQSDETAASDDTAMATAAGSGANGNVHSGPHSSASSTQVEVGTPAVLPLGSATNRNTFDLGEEILHGVSFSVGSGKKLGIVGRTGE